MAKLRFGAQSGLAFFLGPYIDAISFHFKRCKDEKISETSQSAKVRHHQQRPDCRSVQLR